MDTSRIEVENNGGEREPRRIHVPFLSAGKEVGLGEVIKRTTSRLGIQPCDSCNRRANQLNGLVMFSGSKSILTHGHTTPQKSDLQRSVASTDRIPWDAVSEPARPFTPGMVRQGSQEKQNRALGQSSIDASGDVSLLRNTLSRRDFLKLGGAGLAGVALFSVTGGGSAQAATQAGTCWSVTGPCTGWGTRRCIVGPVDPLDPDSGVFEQCCNGWFQYPWIEICSGQHEVQKGCGFCFW